MTKNSKTPNEDENIKIRLREEIGEFKKLIKSKNYLKEFHQSLEIWTDHKLIVRQLELLFN